MTNKEVIKLKLLLLEAKFVGAIFHSLCNITHKFGDKYHEIAKKVFKITGEGEDKE